MPTVLYRQSGILNKESVLAIGKKKIDKKSDSQADSSAIGVMLVMYSVRRTRRLDNKLAHLTPNTALRHVRRYLANAS